MPISMPLATIAVVYSALTLVMLAGLGVIVFRETITAREGVGLVLALSLVGGCAILPVDRRPGGALRRMAALMGDRAPGAGG